MRAVTVTLMLLGGIAALGNAQSVMIGGANAEGVVVELKTKLLPQGFQFEHADHKSALFSLDRGMVPQVGNEYVRGAIVHIVIEFTARFKQKGDSLQVTASEELVGNPRKSVGFRKPVDSRAERETMQRLLDAVKADLEARTTADSTITRDSTRSP